MHNQGVWKWAVALACLALSPASWAQAKAWELSAPAVRQVGNVQIELRGYQAANAEPRSFTLSASDRRHGVNGVFIGACAQLLRVRFLVVDTPKSNLDAYLASRAGRDLPIGDMLAAIQQTLSEQCEDLQVIRVTLDSAITAHKYNYEGTLTKSEGWRLQDGYVPTASDASAPVELAIDEFFGRVRMRHSGKCEPEPTLLLQATSPPALRGGGGTLLPDYASLARSAAVKYTEQCRFVKQMRFAMRPMPDEYTCRVAGDCFLEGARDEDQWTIGHEQLIAKNQAKPINNFDDLAEVLAAGRFDLLEDHRGYFSFFADSFFTTYSDECRSHIRTPVNRSYRITTYKRDRHGNELLPEVGEPVIIFIERDHVSVYDAHAGPAGAFLTTGMLAGALSGINVGRLLLMHQNQMKSLLRNGCDSERNLVIQQNMLNFARAEPPLTGRYGTNKKAAVKYESNIDSAPQFTKVYLAEQTAIALSRRRAYEQPPRATPAPVMPGTVASVSVAELQQQHAAAMEELNKHYQARIKEAGTWERLKLEAELKYKQLQLQREHRDRMSRAQRP